MSEIQIIQSTSIPRITPIKIPVEQSLPNTQHVTKMLPPTLTMPCVTLRNDGTRNNQLFEVDTTNNKTICPLPYYVPLQYDPKELQVIENPEAPTNVDPPETEIDNAELPELPEKPKIECPDPKKNNPRIGDLNSAGTEKVTGFKFIEEEFNDKSSIKKGLLVFGQGSGHGVGMSQWGAKYMASKGQKAGKILKHFYRGVQIKPFCIGNLLFSSSSKNLNLTKLLLRPNLFLRATPEI